MPPKTTVEFHEPAPGGDAALHHVPPASMATVVIFGATGDLAQRKLIPAVYNLWVGGFLPPRVAVVGVGRRDKDDVQFREEMCEALKQHSRTGHGASETCDPFVANLFYHRLDLDRAEDYGVLAGRLDAIERAAGLPGHRLYYLAVGPAFFGPVIERMGEGGLLRGPESDRWARVVFEKPFGMDLDSARALNARVAQFLAEDQIYRIDHYLGKETVQNIFAFRFGNAIFEPLFSRKYVDHVQITMAETVGMEGRRGAFYDQVGTLRDVVQNHLLQLLCLVAMEPPAAFEAKAIRDEKVKVLSALTFPRNDPLETWCVRGQYAGGQGIKGYVSEEGVPADSTTETYVALRLCLDNWRWAGVPFLLRSGKRMKSRVTEIAVQFREPPTQVFRSLGIVPPRANTLVFRIQPNEAISLTFCAKPPGMAFAIEPVDMDFAYGHTFDQALPEAYERLLLDALRGDSTLFMRADEVECAWRVVSGILGAWRDAAPPALYRPGSGGPSEADRLFLGRDSGWRNPG